MVQYDAHCYYHSVARPTALAPTSTVNVVGAVSALDVATAHQIAAVQAVVVADVEAWQEQLELHSTGLLMQHQASASASASDRQQIWHAHQQHSRYLSRLKLRWSQVVVQLGAHAIDAQRYSEQLVRPIGGAAHPT